MVKYRMPQTTLEMRSRVLTEGDDREGPVIYWMSRDQRMNDNWALRYARQAAAAQRAPLGVLFCLVDRFLGATRRQYDFMLQGLQETAESLSRKKIPFFLLRGEPGEEIPRFIEECNARLLVTDFDPLRIKQAWKKDVCARLPISVIEVDTHNIVPCWIASRKQEYAAYTFRPKINKQLHRFLTDLPRMTAHPHPWPGTPRRIDWQKVSSSLEVDETVTAVSWIRPGERAAKRALTRFIRTRLADYDEERNDPNAEGQSGLSPYLHFGQLSPQRAALEVSRSPAPKKAREAFLEELIVRRELSDNFCFYNQDYDRFEGFPAWARKSLDRHRRDRRDYRYSFAEFEAGRTHDPLWNAAQLQMVRSGRMHGYLRMYWAKKILEWCRSPEDAMKTAIVLNDRYELDGRDPNGYAGIAWSIGGVHDRAWGERPVFGKLRYMSARGSAAKFDVRQYIERIEELP